jgi:hypothetical protein
MRSKIKFTVVSLAAVALAGLSFAQDQAKPSAPAPKRDLTGVWMLRMGGGAPPAAGAPAGGRGAGAPPAAGGPPAGGRGAGAAAGGRPRAEQAELTPWGLERFKEAKSSNSGEYTLETTNDPVVSKCMPPGVPRVYYHPFPFEILKEEKGWAMLYEYDHTIRHLYTDGRPVPTDPDITYMGTSVGHWVDDYTLVVETVGQNEKTWLDRNGRQHSDQLKVTETFHRLDNDRLEIAVKMEDPKALVKPWNVMFNAQLRPNWELGEVSCAADNANFVKFEK